MKNDKKPQDQTSSGPSEKLLTVLWIGVPALLIVAALVCIVIFGKGWKNAEATGEKTTQDKNTTYSAATDSGSTAAQNDATAQTTAKAPDPIAISKEEESEAIDKAVSIAENDAPKLNENDNYVTGGDDFKYYKKEEDPNQNEVVRVSQVTNVRDVEENGETVKMATLIYYYTYTDEAAYRAATKLYEGADDCILYPEKLCIAMVLGDVRYDTCVGNVSVADGTLP